MSKRGGIPCASTKRNEQDKSPFLRIPELVLPWLTPPELASLSSTCTILNYLCKSITTARSADASRLLELLPIPFINTLDAHPYAFFLYSPTQLLPSPLLRRQFWASPPSPNPNPRAQFGWSQIGLVSEGGGCHWTEKRVDVSSDCPCLALRCGEVITECGPSCGCGSDCGNRVSQEGVSVRLEIVTVVNKRRGLFAAQFIQSGQFVCEYAGELFDNKRGKETATTI